MLSIDEAIEKHKKMKKASELHNDKRGVFYTAEEHEQLVEWLEELKSIKEMDLSIPQHFTKEQSDWIKAYCIQRNKAFYNKAIDEAICKVEKHKTNGYVTGITNNPFEFGACQMADDIVKILKHLKAGAKDED